MTGKQTIGKFAPGQIVATPHVLALASRAELSGALHRHLSGDWGDVGPEDKASNDAALNDGERILSSYKTARGDVFWIITEWDRSATTFLLPEDY